MIQSLQENGGEKTNWGRKQKSNGFRQSQRKVRVCVPLYMSAHVHSQGRVLRSGAAAAHVSTTAMEAAGGPPAWLSFVLKWWFFCVFDAVKRLQQLLSCCWAAAKVEAPLW